MHAFMHACTIRTYVPPTLYSAAEVAFQLGLELEQEQELELELDS